jgi:hypothetical protein
VAFVAYVSEWERLPEVLARVMQARGLAREDAKAHICGAIGDRRIKIRGQLRNHQTRPLTATEVIHGRYFDVPSDIKPEDFDWESSRPIKSWIVSPEGFRVPGFWHLAWIELFRPDVTSALCGAGESAQARPRLRRATTRVAPALQRAQRAVAELFPEGVPTQIDLPNARLCHRVDAHLRSQGLPGVSVDTILRAAGRRSS